MDLRLVLGIHICFQRQRIRKFYVSQLPYFSDFAELIVKLGWDLEYNKVIRSYHGHLSGVYCMKLHPTLDVLITGGRDSVARVRFLFCESRFVLTV